MTDTPSLVARLEKATGPDRELDEAVALWLGAWQVYRDKHDHWYARWGVTPEKPFGEGERDLGRVRRFDPDTGKPNAAYDIPPIGWGYEVGVPEYTSSLDAVMGLMPEGWSWFTGLLRKRVETPASAQLLCATADPPEYRTYAATPALALLAAILKARGIE